MSQGKAYSDDLRWRAVWLHIFSGLDNEEVRKLLYMSSRSVRRYTEKYYTTSTVRPANQRHGPPRILTYFEQLTVLQLLLDIDEIQRELYDFTQ